MRKNLFLACVSLISLSALFAQPKVAPYVAMEFDLKTPLKFLRAAPVNLAGGDKGFVLLFSEERNVDPFEGSFFFPKFSPKLAVVDSKGKELWRRDLTYSIPGIWFLPVLPFDMNKDGVDEIYYVNNQGPLPLNYDGYKLECADPMTGKVTGEWNWTAPTHNQANSYKWRFSILGGYVDGEPVLVTTQGTYRDMNLQAWTNGMKKRWSLYYPDDFKGPRASHNTALLDLNKDGKWQFMFGERCIGFDDGKELFVLDHDKWYDHSDVVQPFYDSASQSWHFFTCREKGDDGKLPRAVMFDQKGDPIWSIDDKVGHYHYGWVGNYGPKGERYAMAAKYPSAEERKAGKKYEGGVYDAATGKPVEFKPPLTGFVMDFNGDGIHEVFTDRKMFDNKGSVLFEAPKGCDVVSTKHILDLPGEQLMIFTPEGRVQIWADKNAKQTPEMTAHYADPIYAAYARMAASAYNYRYPVLNF